MNAFRTRLAVASLLLPFLFGTACLKSRAQTGDREISLQIGGRTRTCLVHLPPSYTPGRPVPLVLLLHGGGGNGAQAARSYGMNQIADREGFVVAYPNGTSAGTNLLTWNSGNCCGYAQENGVDDVAFVSALLDDLSRAYTVDAKRVYVAGMSNGAMMAYRLACRLSDRIAAIAPVSGALNDTSVAPTSPVSVIIFHGTGDLNVLYNGGAGPKQLSPRKDSSVASAVSFWTDRDACDLVPTTVTSESGDIVTDTYAGGRDGSEVVLTTIKNGGHSWPGTVAPFPGADTPTDEISASELIWAFFKRHPKHGTPPSVRVTSPNGGEVIRRGETLTVTWEVENGEEVTGQSVLLSSDDGSTYAMPVATDLAPEVRSVTWTVPGTLARTQAYRAKVIVATSSGSVASDESDDVFRIKKHAH